MTTDLFKILSESQFPLSKWVWIIIIIIATLFLIAGFIVLEFNLQFESIPTIIISNVILILISVAILFFPIKLGYESAKFSYKWDTIVQSQSTKKLNHQIEIKMEKHPILSHAGTYSYTNQIVTNNLFNKSLKSKLGDISSNTTSDNNISDFISKSNNQIIMHFSTNTRESSIFGTKSILPFSINNSTINTNFDIIFTKNSDNVEIEPTDVNTARLFKIEEKLNDKNIKLKSNSINIDKNTAESLVITALTTDNKIIKITAGTNIDITIN